MLPRSAVRLEDVNFASLFTIGSGLPGPRAPWASLCPSFIEPGGGGATDHNRTYGGLGSVGCCPAEPGGATSRLCSRSSRWPSRSRATWGVLALVVQNHPHRAGADLRRIWGTSLCHGSIHPREGAFGKSG